MLKSTFPGPNLLRHSKSKLEIRIGKKLFDHHHEKTL